MYQLSRDVIKTEGIDDLPKKKFEVPSIFSYNSTQDEVLLLLHQDMVAENKSIKLFETLLKQVTNPEVKGPLEFLRQREIVHYQRLGEAVQLVQDKMEG